MRHGLLLAGITPSWLCGLNIGWDCPSCNRLWPHMTWKFTPFFQGHWQSPCIALIMAGKCLSLVLCQGTVKESIIWRAPIYLTLTCVSPSYMNCYIYHIYISSTQFNGDCSCVLGPVFLIWLDTDPMHKLFSQWQHRSHWKLHCHWLRGFGQCHIPFLTHHPLDKNCSRMVQFRRWNLVNLEIFSLNSLPSDVIDEKSSSV